MDKKYEIRIAVDKDGVQYIQIAGPPSKHKEGHETYFALMDIVKDLDLKIRARFEQYSSNTPADNN